MALPGNLLRYSQTIDESKIRDKPCINLLRFWETRVSFSSDFSQICPMKNQQVGSRSSGPFTICVLDMQRHEICKFENTYRLERQDKKAKFKAWDHLFVTGLWRAFAYLASKYCGHCPRASILIQYIYYYYFVTYSIKVVAINSIWSQISKAQRSALILEWWRNILILLWCITAAAGLFYSYLKSDEMCKLR